MYLQTGARYRQNSTQARRFGRICDTYESAQSLSILPRLWMLGKRTSSRSSKTGASKPSLAETNFLAFPDKHRAFGMLNIYTNRRCCRQ